MITNRQILGIMEQKEEYERKLEILLAAKGICEHFKDINAANKIQEDYNKTMIEYDRWLDSEVK